MTALRRDMLKLAGGAAAGFLFTPVPWRLLGDAAMWTQNWSWIPKVPRGPVTETTTRCTLCPAACAVRARCAAGVPVGLWPAAGPLCPAGFAAHHLAVHPQRLRTLSGARSREEVTEKVKQRLDRGIAVLDLAPGRTASFALRHYLHQLPNSLYIESPSVEGSTAAALSGLLDRPVPLALDLARTKTLLSVSTPVLDGWAAPRLVDGGPRGFHLIQIDVAGSRTAELADEFYPKGSDARLLTAIARYILEEHAEAPAARKCADFPRVREEILGLAVCHPLARHIAETLVKNGPAAVVADGDPANGPVAPAIRTLAAMVNVLLDSTYRPRAEAPIPDGWKLAAAHSLAEVPDGSVHTLLVDEPVPGSTLPWPLVQRKLAREALVITASWSSSAAARFAAIALPTPVFLETVQDAPPAPDSCEARFQISRALMAAPANAVEPLSLIAQLAGHEATSASVLAERAAAILAAKQGRLTKPGEAEPAAIEKSDEFWQALEGGAGWQGDWQGKVPQPARLLPEGTTLAGLLETITAPRMKVPGWRPSAASPLLAKLWQESDLRKAPGARLS
ncbi:MAG: hypothetical protein JNN08_15020 [Bryobacterales bacterium]|nr:hypothetical protein [Bryobacterales bacterium]